ncbi:MAG: amidohydrolase family protein [Halanaerobiaceae bacterium]
MEFKSSYLLKNVKLIGFAAGEKLPEGQCHIGVDSSGKINYIGQKESKESYAREINLDGAYLSPGWIDLHTHIYPGATNLGLEPDRIGPITGVLLNVDAGSAGEANFSGFRKFIVDNFDYPLRAYLNIASTGIVAAGQISELQDISNIDINKTLECIAQNRDLIKGVKMRASSSIVGVWGLTALKLARKISRLADLPLVVHVGEPPVFLSDIVEILAPGDMITHCFNGKRGVNLKEEKEVLQLFRQAQKKGILLDVGHGGASYSQPVARKAYEEHLFPFSISSDLHRFNFRGPAWDLPTIMSKVMAAGFSLKEIIEKVTVNPAHFLELEGWSSLKKDHQACFTVFNVQEGIFPMEDSAAEKEVTTADKNERNQFALQELIVPRISCYGNKVVQAENNYGKN